MVCKKSEILWTERDSFTEGYFGRILPKKKKKEDVRRRWPGPLFVYDRTVESLLRGIFMGRNSSSTI